MASYVPAKRGVPYITWTSLVAQATRPSFKTTPTLAGGDVKISKDGGGLNNLTTLPTVTPGSSPLVKITLTGLEMEADVVTIIFQDAAGTEWDDQLLVIPTVNKQIDESITTVRTGIVGAGSGPNLIWLDSGSSATNNIYNGNVITIYSGTGTGQSRIIIAYTGDSKLAQVTPPWVLVPDNTATFCIVPTGHSDIAAWRGDIPDKLICGKISSAEVIFSGTTTGGGGSVIPLDTSANSANNQFYKGDQFWIVSGSAVGQQRVITNYSFSTLEVTVTPAFNPVVATGDRFVITRGGGVDLELWKYDSTINSATQGKINVLPPNSNSSSTISVTSGTSNTITFGSEAIGQDQFYTGNIVTIVIGTQGAQEQSRFIINYTASKIATVSPPWTKIPVTGDSAILSPGFMSSQTIASGIADQIFDRVNMAEGFSLRQLCRLYASALLGKANGLAGTTVRYRDIGDTKDRITATVDADGNRSVVTLDGS